MRRTGALVAGLVLAGGIAASAPASADAGTTCVAGAQSIKLSAGIYYPVIGPTQTDVSTSFSATCAGTQTGAASVSATLAAANCGNSSGSGTLTLGGHDHAFGLVTAGGTIVVSGQVNGTVNATPAPGESCVYPGPGADTFLLTGSVTLA